VARGLVGQCRAYKNADSLRPEAQPTPSVARQVAKPSEIGTESRPWVFLGPGDFVLGLSLVAFFLRDLECRPRDCRRSVCPATVGKVQQAPLSKRSKQKRPGDPGYEGFEDL
jgi:hypothetical protein